MEDNRPDTRMSAFRWVKPQKSDDVSHGKDLAGPLVKMNAVLISEYMHGIRADD